MIEQVLPLLVVVVLIGAATLWYRRTTGTARPATATFSADELRRLGAPRRGPVMLLFTAPGCSSCAAARRVLDDSSACLGVPVVAVDVAREAGIAQAQHVYRAPTTFVLDDRGRALARITGVPRAAELDDAVTAAAPAAGGRTR